MALEFLRCVQKALFSAGYDDIILKVKQVICLESLYLKKDLVAVLPTGYGKSLVFQVLPRLLREREETRATTSVTKSVVFVVSPLNALMYDQISKLRARGVEAAVLGVKKGIDADSPVISQWEAGYEIVFCHPEAFLSCNNGLEVLQSSVYLSAVKAVVVDEAHS
ncbi:probable ATP-dependent DNA helicase RecS [Montipora capricornis]|uniref:probable ATP-dependent DNA helicase RecS n=1 Tax=Montipora capricornis TaxID=246305 RepID=UPI0035F197D2